MKKINEQSEEPRITRLPSAGSEAPLVIDLPDGQKLIVGNIPVGTVIEIATWRGTGRPDSRTNRMMLGVANAALEVEGAEESSPETYSSKPAKQSKISQAIRLPKLFLFWLLNKNPEEVSRNKRDEKKKLKILPRLQLILNKAFKGRANARMESESFESTQLIEKLLSEIKHQNSDDIFTPATHKSRKSEINGLKSTKVARKTRSKPRSKNRRH